jgi:hypothetical protein
MEPLTDKGNTLILSHKNTRNSKISEKKLLDDTFIEVTWEGKVIWEWICNDHFEEMHFSEEAKNTMSRNPHLIKNDSGEIGDWMHINSMSALGPNKWYSAGDERFHPDNIIWCARSTNITAITSKKTGKIVWQAGPDFEHDRAIKSLGQIIGQHHAHMIPKGLPGEGNILVFDNGGWAGYGAPNPGAPTGVDNALRDYSRVLEYDPITFKILWQYTPQEGGFPIPPFAFMFYSGFVSSAQRLPNGNTLITEGAYGRIFEVTANHEIVWEFVNPYKGWQKKLELKDSRPSPGVFTPPKGINMVYRAYRIPYDWIPQVNKPEEREIARVDNKIFRVPGSPRKRSGKFTAIKSRARLESGDQYCVIPKDIRPEM